MRLIAIRHGETLWNRESRVMGQLDSPLTERGERQAEALARRLAHADVDTLYSSDLGRAVQTAGPIAQACAKTLLLDEGVRERDMGIFQGLTKAEMHARFPEERAAYEGIGFEYVIPEGESARQRLERSVAALTTIAERHAGGSVAVITHGGVLGGFLQYVLGIPPTRGRRFRLHNAGISVFHHQAGQWTLETWNDMSHLKERERSR